MGRVTISLAQTYYPNEHTENEHTENEHTVNEPTQEYTHVYPMDRYSESEFRTQTEPYSTKFDWTALKVMTKIQTISNDFKW